MMEVGLSIELRVSEEVDESSLLDRFILTVNTVVLKLLLGVSQMLVLDHLDLISPLVTKLTVLIVSVHIVEHGELWTNEVSKVTNLDQTNVECNKELVMPDHSSEPVIVLPTTKSRDGVDRSDVKTKENKTST